ncbi:MAG: VTT domain-containing protein, partial [Candidatus Latescibacteria bacterium]|nr:VTT domain-containing protein [Candidatus Latescibacterota bacterium]
YKGRSFFMGSRWDKHVKKAERWFDRYGEGVVIVSRFLPGVRAVVSALAGISGMRPRKVAFYAFVSVVFWYGALITLGLTVEANWRLAVGLVEQYNRVLIIGITAIAVISVVYLMIHNHSPQRSGLGQRAQDELALRRPGVERERDGNQGLDETIAVSPNQTSSEQSAE